MKKLFYVLAIVLLSLQALPAYAKDVFPQYDKVIWLDQENQVGAAYGLGRKLLEFTILSGDDETPTPPGAYVIKLKNKTYYSRKYDTPMPYSLFFDLKGMRAIHEGAVPDPKEKEEWATHGCIHVEQPYMKWLYEWAEQGRTVVMVRGQRIGPEEEKPGGEGTQERETNCKRGRTSKPGTEGNLFFSEKGRPSGSPLLFECRAGETPVPLLPISPFRF